MLEAPHAVQNVELLPAFREIDLPVDEVGVPQVDEGQVLEDETPAKKKEMNEWWMSARSHESQNKPQGKKAHLLTSTGCTGAPLQPVLLCTP